MLPRRLQCYNYFVTLLDYCNHQVYPTQEVSKLELYSDIIRLL